MSLYCLLGCITESRKNVSVSPILPKRLENRKMSLSLRLMLAVASVLVRIVWGNGKKSGWSLLLGAGAHWEVSCYNCCSIVVVARPPVGAMADVSLSLLGRRSIVQYNGERDVWHERLEIFPIFAASRGQRAARVVLTPDDDFYLEDFARYSRYELIDPRRGFIQLASLVKLYSSKCLSNGVN